MDLSYGKVVNERANNARVLPFIVCCNWEQCHTPIVSNITISFMLTTNVHCKARDICIKEGSNSGNKATTYRPFNSPNTCTTRALVWCCLMNESVN